MIELTVKTLNSVNHPFTVPDETTVRQLKELIREKLDIAIEDQRLIFCGRVLQDAKLLSEFGVDGKVLHLVERMPPNTSSNSQSGGATTTAPTNSGNNGQQFRRVMFPLNQELESALFLEALAVPSMLAEVGNANQGQASSTGDRLDFVRRMIQEIKRKLNSLDYRQDANETYSSLSGDSDLDESNDENNDEHMDTENSMDANGDVLQDEAMPEDPNGDQNPEDQNMSFESQSSMGTGESGDSTRRGADMQFELADILQELDMLQHRLVPLTQTLLDVLRPLSPEEQRSTRQTRREQNQVELAFETFHSLAHVYHALSDLNITVDGRHSHLSSEQMSLRHAMPIQTSINFLSNQPRPTQVGGDRVAGQNASPGTAAQGSGANQGSENAGQPNAPGANPNAQPNANSRPEPVSYHLEIETRVPIAVALSNGWMNNQGPLNVQRQMPAGQNQARPAGQAAQEQAASGQAQEQAQPQAQAQTQPQAQAESQGQAQPRAQTQPQGQAQGQSQSGQPKAPNQPSSGNQSSQGRGSNAAPPPQGNANAGAGRSGSFGRQGRPPPSNLMDMMADITMAIHPPPPVPPELQALGEAHMMTGPIPLPIPNDPVQSFLHTLMHRSGLMGPLLAAANGLNAANNRTQNTTSTGQNATSAGPNANSGQTAANAEQNATRPGQTATNAGQTATNAGQTATTPGQTATAPAQTAAAPGQTAAAPGQTATNPGQTATTPGQTAVHPKRAASAATTNQGETSAKKQDTTNSAEQAAANSAQAAANDGPTATTQGQASENQGATSGQNAGQGPIYVTNRQPAGFTAINIPVNFSGQGNFRLATPILNANSRPGQRVIRNQIPTLNSLLFDRFLPCDSHHIRRRLQSGREEGVMTSRNSSAPNNAEHNGSGQRPQGRYHFSNNWIRDIIDIFLHEFTFEELMLSLQGTTLAYDEIRDSLRAYVESVLVPPEPSPDSYETPIDEAFLHAAGDLMRQHTQFLRQLALVLPLRPGIDVAASYRSVVYARLPHMFRAIMNTDPDAWSYNRRFHEAMLAFFTEIAALTYYVTNNSYVGVNVMITNLFEEISSGFAPLFRVWVLVMVRLALDYIREALPGLADSIVEYVVLTNGRRMVRHPAPPGMIPLPSPPSHGTWVNMSAPTANEDRDDVAAAATGYERGNVAPPPPGLERPSVIPLPMGEAAAQELAAEERPHVTPPTPGFEQVYTVPATVVSPRPPQLFVDEIELPFRHGPSVSGTPSPEDDSNASGDNSDPAWTDFPDEWVPVIRQDEERQVASLAGAMERPPLSDAYLTGMASRKRKMVQQARPPQSLDALLHDSLVEAIGDREEAEELLASEGEALREFCAEQLRSLGRQRLEGSEDYAPADFPAAHRFYFGDRSSNY